MSNSQSERFLVVLVVRQDEESRLLREKAAALEERVLESDARRRDADDEFARNRRLVQLLDNYKSQLNDAQSQLDDLQNRVGDFAHLQVRPPASPPCSVGFDEFLLVRVRSRWSGGRSLTDHLVGEFAGGGQK